MQVRAYDTHGRYRGIMTHLRFRRLDLGIATRHAPQIDSVKRAQGSRASPTSVSELRDFIVRFTYDIAGCLR
jgi:hypothetical protein